MVRRTPDGRLRAYGDESIRSRWYWLAVVLVPRHNEPAVETQVRSLCLPGQRQLHLKAERDSRRRAIISSVVGGGRIRAWLYRAPRPVVEARESCLRAMVENLVSAGADQLCLDQVDERQRVRDRVAIRDVLHKQRADLTYRHARPWEHAGIQVADIVAWAYGAGGDWRRRVRPIVERVIDLDR